MQQRGTENYASWQSHPRFLHNREGRKKREELKLTEHNKDTTLPCSSRVLFVSLPIITPAKAGSTMLLPRNSRGYRDNLVHLHTNLRHLSHRGQHATSPPRECALENVREAGRFPDELIITAGGLVLIWSEGWGERGRNERVPVALPGPRRGHEACRALTQLAAPRESRLPPQHR